MFRTLSVFSKYHKQPNSWRRDLLWKLLFSQLIKKFSHFYVTRKIITVFSRSLYCNLMSSLVSSSSLCLGHANDLYLSVPRLKSCVHFSCPIFIYFSLYTIHHILDLTTWVIFGEEYSSYVHEPLIKYIYIYIFLHPITFSVLRPNILSALHSKTLSVYIGRAIWNMFGTDGPYKLQVCFNPSHINFYLSVTECKCARRI